MPRKSAFEMLKGVKAEILENKDKIDVIIYDKFTEFTRMMSDPDYVNFLDEIVDKEISDDSISKISNVLSCIYKQYIPGLIVTCKKIIETYNNDNDDDSKIKLKKIITKIKDYFEKKDQELNAKGKLPMEGGIVLATGAAGIVLVICSIITVGWCALIGVVMILGFGLSVLYLSSKMAEASSQELQQQRLNINKVKRIEEGVSGGKKQKRNFTN